MGESDYVLGCSGDDVECESVAGDGLLERIGMETQACCGDCNCWLRRKEFERFYSRLFIPREHFELHNALFVVIGLQLGINSSVGSPSPRADS